MSKAMHNRDCKLVNKLHQIQNKQEVLKIKLVNIDTDEAIAERVKGAYTFWSRFKGLMLTESMPENEALHISPCTAIHTFFMKYSIDIIYLNKEKEIVGIEEYLEPGRIGKKFMNVKSVIELPAGTIRNTSTAVGQKVNLDD
ncbi:DUF192 domain-containing protein [Oceanobacillus saliphilus]|uniref:DUF192 domain-containing protein n=1 Tax=Oceanobacillus saliphilus TaxID=2925834 RepID=UPI00201DB684|nr:DUF192 domain-containing protein [Oceanobacillus saliphilus]